MEQQESFGRRLRQIMRERGLNYEAFGKVLDMRPQTLNRYVLDQREPKAQVVLERARGTGRKAVAAFPSTAASPVEPGPWRTKRLRDTPPLTWLTGADTVTCGWLGRS